MGFSKSLKLLKDKCLATLDDLIISFTGQLEDVKTQLLINVDKMVETLEELKKQDSYVGE